ncbi:MAG: DUF3108 domain-containing protein [Blastocatellia bacterium]
MTHYAQQQPQGLTQPSKPSPSKPQPGSNSGSNKDNTAVLEGIDGNPFVVGERLVYGVSLVGFPNAGRLEVEVAERGLFFDHESYQIRAKVESLGQVRSLFGELDNQYTSYVNVNTALPHRVITSARQGPARTEETVILDQSKKQALFADDSTVEIPGETHDLLSLAFALRLRPLNEGSTQRINLLYGKQLVEVEAEVKPRERVQTQAGAFSAIQVKLTPRKKFAKYRTRVWFSDDSKRLPVLITTRISIGEVRAELASVGVNVRPLPPLAKADPLKQDESGIIVALPVGGGSPGGNGHSNPTIGNNPGGSNPPSLSGPGSAGKENGYPFAVGERLNYDISWGNFAAVGKASFEVRRLGMLGPNRVFEFFGEASSTGAARQLINVNDQMSSFALVDSLVPVRNDLRLREGKRSRQVTATYDWSKRQALLSSGTQTEIPPGTLDLISLFYTVRAADLKVGATFSHLFLDANHRLQSVTLRVARQEPINSPVGTRDAMQLDILAPEPAKLLLGQVWISNDSRRLPLYIVTRTRFGEIRFQLTSAANTR